MKTTIVSLLVALSAPLMAGDLPILNFKKARPVVFKNLFLTYDKDGDELIDWEEFQNTVGTSNVPVITEWRFFYMADGFLPAGLEITPFGSKGGFGIDLETYIRFAGGLRVPGPTRAQIFDLADDDNDGFLDPDEYANTRKFGTGNYNKSFRKLDDNEDLLISPSEFGLSIKV